MKLCGFEIAIDRPMFLIAGRPRRAEQDSVGVLADGCDPVAGCGPAVRCEDVQ